MSSARGMVGQAGRTVPSYVMDWCILSLWSARRALRVRLVTQHRGTISPGRGLLTAKVLPNPLDAGTHGSRSVCETVPVHGTERGRTGQSHGRPQVCCLLSPNAASRFGQRDAGPDDHMHM